MFVIKRVRKRIITLVFVILLFVYKSDGAENDLQVSDDETQSDDDAFVAANKNEDYSENGENPIQGEDNAGNSKLDNSDKKPPIKDDDGKSESCNSIYGDLQVVPIDACTSKTAEGSKQTYVVENEKNADVNLKDSNNLSGAYKKTSKTHDSNQKTSLDDVDSLNAAEDEAQVEKRDTFPLGYWGMPRDASYFFDDLEPFIDNFSDNRVGRAAPTHETKLQKFKISSKEKETNKNDFDEEENELENLEPEEVSVKEVDYEDENDEEDEEESDCDSTTSPICATTSTCPTTKTTCSTTTPCPTTKSTTVCTTPTQCKTTTKCKTTTQCKTPTQCKTTTKSPSKFCAKVKEKQIGYSVTTVNSFEWDREKRKFNNKKRKYHSKVTDVKN